MEFFGRARLTSVKNFILVSDSEPKKVLMLLGKIGDEEYNMDFCFPLTPLQAFGIAVTSLDYKLALE